MTIRRWTVRALVALATLALLPACGGGSSGPTTGVGIGGTGKHPNRPDCLKIGIDAKKS